MRESHNLSVDVKVTKNVGRPSCQIITNKKFGNISNNQVNYAKFSNHDNLSMI